ncbi:hypothetical protein [Algoriphagus antarcticus]|uniref:Uncharacterized protein n=1 Tax=Algoriphagus antarcticus TaxID=238540 RepID=A0A3E0E8T1_9BACT|nr:hypothetical protein [Algoriphagus antarcticus]REG94664.1 hypothetical protein C8N25_101500 [Algoriphagus antarcticus]
MKNLVSLFALIIAFSLLASCKAYRNPNNLNPKYPIKSPELADKIPGLQNLLVGDQLKITGIDKSVKFLVYSGVGKGISQEIYGKIKVENLVSLNTSLSPWIKLILSRSNEKVLELLWLGLLDWV